MLQALILVSLLTLQTEYEPTVSSNEYVEEITETVGADTDEENEEENVFDIADDVSIYDATISDNTAYDIEDSINLDSDTYSISALSLAQDYSFASDNKETLNTEEIDNPITEEMIDYTEYAQVIIIILGMCVGALISNGMFTHLKL